MWNMFKLNNKDTRTTLLVSPGVFINFYNISHIALLFLLLILNK